MSLNCDNKTPRDGTFLGEKQPTHLYQVHIADGFSSDCDEIVHRCLQLENLNFQEFTKIWKDMNFDLLYEGRAASTEIAELSEELIHVAKHYMVKDTSYFEESVTGLFLVYSLIHLQPFPGFARLRLVPGDVKPISRIEAVARRERRLDVLYILGDVLVHWTQYHADERPRGMERPVKKYLDGYISIDKLGSRPKGVFYLQSEELDHIRELGPITRQYGLAKAAIFNSGIEQDMRNPQYISKSLASEVAASLRDLIIGLNPDASVPAPHQRDANNAPSSKAETKTSEERSRILQAIKARAMSNAVDPMNHLTSAQARKKPKPRLNIAGDLKKPTGRIRTGAHIRPGTISPKKPKTTMKSVMKSRLEQTCFEADLDMESFKQVQEDGTPEQESPGPQNSRAIDIEIDSLPLILKAGDMGPDIEIEIIDHAKSNTDKTAPKTASSTKTNKTAGSEIEIEIVDHKKRNKGKQTEPKAANSTETTKTSSSEDDDTQMLTINPRALKMFMKDGKDGKTELVDGFPLKKKERRDMKRRDIKSKFKKLGMLQIANLEDKEI